MRAAVVPAALYLIVAILVLPVFPHFTSPNELSRWALAVALIDDRTIEVTAVLARTDLTRIEDTAMVEGRIYSNKAPGLSMLAAPAYAAVRPFTGPATADSIRPTMTVMRIATSTIPAILLAIWVAAVAARSGCDAGRIRLAITLLLFATPLFAYGLLFFSHAFSALALFGSWALLFASTRARRHELAAGALIGLGVLCEYPGAIPAAVIVACALPRLRAGGLLRILAGGVPFAILLGWYNHAAFGSVFTLSSAHERDPAFRELAGSGLFGIGLPSPANLLAMLLDPSKGLLILSPVLVIAAFGIGAARRMMPRAALLALIAAPAVLFLTMAGYPNWHGGWTVGVRYVVPVLPFLALAVAFARRTALEAFLLGASAGVVAIVSLVFPFVPPGQNAPWISFSWPLLREGLVAPNLLHLVWQPLAVGVPFLLAAAAVVAAVPSRRMALAAIAGFAVWFGAGFVAHRFAPPANPTVRLIAQEVYFEREGTIRRTLPPGPARERLESFARALRASPPSSWPF
ncbi:MAG TPA: hypothetical protein VM779_04105 [Thermoanaerobaculia bacterium]|nr:hypothetical protein [Thermoanaerobaculia bacterium]